MGSPRLLLEGCFTAKLKSRIYLSRKGATSLSSKSAKILKQNDESTLLLECGVEIRAYSLCKSVEIKREELIQRSVEILSAPIPYDPRVDLVAADLSVIPATLSRIDSGKQTCITCRSLLFS